MTARHTVPECRKRPLPASTENRAQRLPISKGRARETKYFERGTHGSVAHCTWVRILKDALLSGLL